MGDLAAAAAAVDAANAEDPTTVVVVTNSGQLTSVTPTATGTVAQGASVLTVEI